MASLIIVCAPPTGTDGPETSLPIILDDREAFRQGAQLERILQARRMTTFAVRDSGGGEVCRIDLRRLRSVRVDATIAAAPIPGACGKSMEANDPPSG